MEYLRVKTKTEFINEFGIAWRTRVGIGFCSSMDKYLGRVLSINSINNCLSYTDVYNKWLDDKNIRVKDKDNHWTLSTDMLTPIKIGDYILIDGETAKIIYIDKDDYDVPIKVIYNINNIEYWIGIEDVKIHYIGDTPSEKENVYDSKKYEWDLSAFNSRIRSSKTKSNNSTTTTSIEFKSTKQIQI